MNISNSYPPNYKEIEAKFHPAKNVVFTYGDTIYAPHVFFALPQDLIVHEETHMKYQGNRPDLWWKDYIESTEFRFDQELEAYRKQYQYFKQRNTKRETRKFIRDIAKDLSGKLYHNVCSYEEALFLIGE